MKFYKGCCFFCLFFLKLNFISAIDLTEIEFGSNKIFNDQIKTPTLFPPNYPFANPVIQMNTSDILELRFDLLGTDVKDLSYTILQCDYEWTPTILNQYEYIDGFSEVEITDYDNSFNTLVDYVHYKLHIPNQDMQITKSGNYVIIVFESNSEEILFMRRFMVFDPKVQILGNVFLPNNPFKQEQYQDIQFTVSHKGLEISSPYQEVNAVVTQNERPDIAIGGLKPLMFGKEELRFNHNMKSAFKTGKEFRWFDMRSLRFRAEGIKHIQQIQEENHVYLHYDPIRSNRDYRFEDDLNGKFLTETIESPHPFIEGDYAYVHFDFKVPAKLKDQEVYIIGGFNDWQLLPENKMRFNASKGTYETTLFLKQGFYNYTFATVNETSKVPDVDFTDGHFYDTENDYTIYLYHRPFGELYDQLIGITYLNSRLNRY